MSWCGLSYISPLPFYDKIKKNKINLCYKNENKKKQFPILKKKTWNYSNFQSYWTNFLSLASIVQNLKRPSRRSRQPLNLLMENFMQKFTIKTNPNVNLKKLTLISIAKK